MVLYEELRAVAQNLMRGDALERQIDRTELIGEIWLKGQSDKELPRDRKQFFGRAFRHMARELIDRARARDAAKRGGGWTKRPLDVVAGELSSIDRLDAEQKEATVLLMESWQGLNEVFPDEATVAFCRLVLGLTNDETARTLDRPPKTAENQWYFARAKLRDALEEAGDTP